MSLKRQIVSPDGTTSNIDISKEQDSELASLKLSTTGISIDSLTDEQIKYSTDYSAGT